MKAAMWGVGLFVLGLLGLVLVNLFGNITVTNQLNYTTMKNSVEAAMYDALDIAYYRSGFCLCTNRSKTNDKWVFNDDTEYELSDIVYDDDHNETCVSDKTNCEVMMGEYRVNPQVFSESLIRRFAEMVNNKKDYRIVIQDIIEYPPKVSVRIDTYNEEYSPTDKESGTYTIVNQVDAIIETKKEALAKPPVSEEKTIETVEITPTPTPAETSTPTPTPAETSKGCKKYGWVATDTKNKVQACPTDSKGKKDKPKEGTYYWKASNATCKKVSYKLCYTCSGGASITNANNGNCITVSSCSTKPACAPGTSANTKSCTKEESTYACKDCKKMVYKCVD